MRYDQAQFELRHLYHLLDSSQAVALLASSDARQIKREALERVLPDYPRRIPLELSEEELCELQSVLVADINRRPARDSGYTVYLGALRRKLRAFHLAAHAGAWFHG